MATQQKGTEGTRPSISVQKGWKAIHRQGGMPKVHE